MNATVAARRVIDADTHVIEPYDLWTSRMSAAKYGDLIPHVKYVPAKGEDCWFFGDNMVNGAASPAMAGLNETPPNHPKQMADVKRYTWDASERLKLMDEYGIQAQVLFPNVVLLHAPKMLKNLALNNMSALLDTVRAYNDWQTDWSSAAPKRLLPQTVLPFWDLDEAIKEMTRCAKMGHRGIVFTSEPHCFFGLPKLTHPHWDRLWGAAQDMELPVNFHIGSGDHEQNLVMDASVSAHAAYASHGVLFFMSNASALTQLICGGICHRFPRLNFISVESGVGWIPFALASIDWQWINCGVAKEHPEYKLLPSEYFKRQIYACFWFERETLGHALASLGADNILYETDFPHPTSMSPGPTSSAQRPPDYIRDVFRGIPDAQAEKILYGNAARLYHLD
jgi:predicted TIM-barrel fold metal-dependent hydrolase